MFKAFSSGWTCFVAVLKTFLMYNFFMDANELIKYFKSLGLTVHTTTKARGHQGFFLKNRIDISKNISENRVVPTLLHEFAHYIHSKLEPDMNKTGGSLEVLFQSNNPLYKEELIKVTNFVDNNSLCIRLFEHKDRVKQKIKEYEAEVKKYYPKFMRSKKAFKRSLFVEI